MNVSVVIPVYKSAATLELLLKELVEALRLMKVGYEIIFVDDCCPDNSWETLKSIKEGNDQVRILRLANNVGQWMATLAGISKSTGDLVITIDDDLEYDTKDILKLYQQYIQSDAYIIYGIPEEKRNKNLSYKLFFKLRDKFLRVFFGKIKTESLKIFNRKIYFDESGEMYSQMHFEAYTKFTVSTKYINYVNVNYRKRLAGQSNHTLWMKVRILARYGIEYYKSPFRYLLYLLFLLGIILFLGDFIELPQFLLSFSKITILTSGIFIAGILGKYLSNMYFKLKGLPEYIIIEEF